MTDLAGKHVIVTGGSQGIGAAVAREAAALGAHVSLIARGEKALRSTAESIAPTARWSACDVTDTEALTRAIRSLETDVGPCDVLVCCAGVALPGRFLDIPLQELEDQWRVNVWGAAAAVGSVAPGMAERGAGHLVLVSSTAGILGVPGYTGYAATKFAIRGFAESLRYELEPLGVTVTVLFPPDTQTPGFDAENLRKPPETAAISGNITPFAAKRVAEKLIHGIQRNQRSVTVDATTSILRRFGGILEPAVHWSFLRTVRRVRGL